MAASSTTTATATATASQTDSCLAKEEEDWNDWQFAVEHADLNKTLAELKATAAAIRQRRQGASTASNSSSLYVISLPPATPIQQQIHDVYHSALDWLHRVVLPDSYHPDNDTDDNDDDDDDDDDGDSSDDDNKNIDDEVMEATQRRVARRLVRVVRALEELKAEVMRLRDEARAQAAAAQDQELEGLLATFRETWERLVASAQNVAAAVPWQLQYKLLSPSGAKQVDFEGAGITDAKGRLINVQECAVSGVVIQNWAYGEGAERYYSLDGDQAATVPCYLLVRRAAELRDEYLPLLATSSSLQRVCRYLDALQPRQFYWVLERNIATFLKFPVTGARTAAEAVDAALRSYGDRPLFGTHRLAGEAFTWQTYRSVRERVFDLALAMRYVLQLPAIGTAVGLCTADNRPDWLHAFFAALLNGFMAVGVMANWPVDDIAYVAADADISCFFVDARTWPTVDAAVRRRLQQQQDAKKVWLLSVEPVDTPLLLSPTPWPSAGPPLVELLTVDQLIAQYHAHRRRCAADDVLVTYTGRAPHSSSPFAVEAASDDGQSVDQPDAVVSLLYSSGTSGRPKGIVEQQARWMVQLRRTSQLRPHVVVSYAPLAHGMDRGMVIDAFVNGGRVAFHRHADGTAEFLTELAVAQPTAFAAMPGFWTQLYAQATGGSLDARAAFGPRIRVVATGGSHTPHDVFAWMQHTFGGGDDDDDDDDDDDRVTVSNSYGLSEFPGVCQNGVLLDGVALRLAPVSLAGGETFSPDDRQPRGEILVKGPALTKGYWRLQRETAEAFTADGYFRTGDVGLLDDDKRLHIVDRVKNFCEVYRDGRSVWVSTSRVETALRSMPAVHEAYVHGDRMESALIAVLSLRASVAERQLLDDVRAELSRQGFAEHEIPAAVIVSPERWDVQSGLLLGVGKPNRRAIRDRYQLQLARKYLELNSAQQ